MWPFFSCRTELTEIVSVVAEAMAAQDQLWGLVILTLIPGQALQNGFLLGSKGFDPGSIFIAQLGLQVLRDEEQMPDFSIVSQLAVAISAVIESAVDGFRVLFEKTANAAISQFPVPLGFLIAPRRALKKPEETLPKFRHWGASMVRDSVCISVDKARMVQPLPPAHEGLKEL